MKGLSYILLFLLCISSKLNVAQINFIENKGQLKTIDGNSANDVLFYADAGNIRYYISKTGIRYVLAQPIENTDQTLNKVTENLADFHMQNFKGWRIDMNWSGTNAGVKVFGESQKTHKLNYYTPTFPNGLIGIRSFEKVIIKNIYQNIDVVFYSTNNQLKYDYIIHKGGNYKQIKFWYDGVDEVELENDSLELKTSIGVVKDYMPESYLVNAGKSKKISMHFKRESKKSFSVYTNEAISGFDQMVIDPAIWITYFGGSGLEYSYDIECDKNGNIYMTGYNGSVDFPVTPGAFQTTSASLTPTGQANYISKFSSAGNLLWSTYYSGSYFEEAHGVCVDSLNFVYMCGNTYSTDFPITAGAYQTTLSGSADAFLVKFDEDGVRQWATYLGGTGFDNANKIDKDNNNNIWIVGGTASAAFPTLAAYDATYNGGGNDVFLSKFSPGGALLYSTFMGGAVEETGIDIDFTPGFIGITGNTRSPTFPVTVDAFDAVLGGALSDGFYAKFDLTGALVYSTMMGGMDLDLPQSINYDKLGCAVIGGHVKSVDFPTTPGALQTVFGGSTQDCFLMRFNVDNSIHWSTYYGNNHWEYSAGVTIDDDNNIFLNGYWRTDFSFADLPVLDCGFQKSFGGGEDNFVAKFDLNCVPICTTYLGGTLLDANDIPGACIEYSNKFIHVATYTEGDFPVTAGAYQTTFGGYYDVGLAKLCSIGCGDTLSSLADFVVNDTICLNTPVQFHGQGISCDNSLIQYQWNFPGGTPASSTLQDPFVTYSTAGSFTATLTVLTPCDTTIKSVSFTVGVLGLLTLDLLPSADSVCAGDVITITSAVGGGVGPFSYVWSTNPSDTLANLTIAPASSGYISLYVENAGNCPVLDSVYITSLSTSDIIATADTCVCEGSSIVLTATGAPAYNWNTGQTGSSITITPLVPFDYIVSYTNGVCGSSDTVSVCVNPSPTVVASNDTTITGISPAEGVQVQLEATGDAPFTWSPSTGLSCTVCPNPTATVTNTTTYMVTVTNAFGCSASDEVTILFEMQIPNIITPNGDGINDKFNITGLPPNSSVQIFNRWGNLLYSSSNYGNDWSSLTNGVYYYILKTEKGDAISGFFHVAGN